MLTMGEASLTPLSETRVCSLLLLLFFLYLYSNLTPLGINNQSEVLVSAQKALQGSKTETRELLGGTEENIFSPQCGVGH